MNEREYAFSDGDFNRLRNLVADHTGISLSDAKKDLVYGRLSKRLRALGLTSFSTYADYVADDVGDEIENFTNAITTNLTSFFRESHHFEHLEKIVLPILKMSNAKSRRIRIWSAGCSTGEEPYSIAISVIEADPELANWDVKILATDLDSNCVRHAAVGIYDHERIESLPDERRCRWFRKGSGEFEGKVLVDHQLQDMITFKELNLMHDWPIRGPFDMIFCRNVIIYFDKATQRVLFKRFARLVADDAYLYLGHSESLFNVTEQFKLLERTIYRRAL
ncbi:MAG: chemotaxis protein CheR [Proteobacteria bacterium]|nr:MAG: chemotaxis protein CheR [Pseudomonadota bacterium]